MLRSDIIFLNCEGKAHDLQSCVHQCLAIFVEGRRYSFSYQGVPLNGGEQSRERDEYQFGYTARSRIFHPEMTGVPWN